MKTIAIIGQKGGTGKTTATLGLAVCAELAGHPTAILDLDPQTNAANWKDRRDNRPDAQAQGPAVESIQPGRLRQTLKAAEANGAAFVFIDTPGKSDTAAIEAARVADLVLIPVRPQIFDLETLAAVRDALRVAGSPAAYVVLNGIHPSASRSPGEQRKVIAQAFDLPVCPVHLSHYAVHAEAPDSGQTPLELKPDSRAAVELKALYRFVLETARERHAAPVKAEAAR